MNVNELIELTSQLSLDEDYIDAKDRQQYLRYLNIANNELYAVASGGLPTLVKAVDIFLDSTNQSFILPQDLYKIRFVYINKTKLTKVDASNIYYPQAEQYAVSGNNLHCNILNTGFEFLTKSDPIDNVIKKYITLYYVPNPKALVETVSNPLTETDTPVYPEPYHHFLAYGALYLFYYPNKVFMEKISYIGKDWKDAKSELANFKNYGL